MGTDKGLLPFRGVSMVAYILRQVKNLGEETFIITNNIEAYNHIDVPVFPDVIPGLGALGGLYSALRRAKHNYVLALACDMPFINRPLLEHMMALAHGYDAVVPRLNSKLCEPFRSVYAKSCLGPIKVAIDTGERRATGFLHLVQVRYVEREEIEKFDYSLTSFFNVNSPEELAEAERLAVAQTP